MTNANDLLDETATDETKLTQEDYDRAAKLNAGITKLQEEFDILKARIKAEATNPGTSVHGKVVVKVSERNDKDVAAMTEAYPFDSNSELYTPVLDVKKVPTASLIFKDTIKVVSITFAN